MRCAPSAVRLVADHGDALDPVHDLRHWPSSGRLIRSGWNTARLSHMKASWIPVPSQGDHALIAGAFAPNGCAPGCRFAGARAPRAPCSGSRRRPSRRSAAGIPRPAIPCVPSTCLLKRPLGHHAPRPAGRRSVHDLPPPAGFVLSHQEGHSDRPGSPGEHHGFPAWLDRLRAGPGAVGPRFENRPIADPPRKSASKSSDSVPSARCLSRKAPIVSSTSAGVMPRSTANSRSPAIGSQSSEIRAPAPAGFLFFSGAGE